MSGDRTFHFNEGCHVTFNDIHDNNNCTIITASTKPTVVAMPKENDYKAVVQWLQSEKEQGRDYYAEAGNNRSRMCREISNILGWVVDQNSLRKAQE